MKSIKNKVHWRCRRGMLELDLLLQHFLQTRYDLLTQREQITFERLLEYPDAVLFDLLMGKTITSDRELGCVIERIRTNTAH